MRIASGAYKGHPIKICGKIRPTMESIKNLIFNILNHNQVFRNQLKGGVVLDLFCGTGAYGLESLSNGAQHIFMVDKDISAAAKNSIPFKKQVTLIKKNICAGMVSAIAPCDLVFLDPPYINDDYHSILSDIAKKGWVKLGATVVLELSAKKKYKNFQDYKLLDKRKRGKVEVLIARFMPYDINVLRRLIVNEFEDAEVSLEDMVGDNDHFFLTVISDKFRKKSILEQHRMVYSVLKGKLGNEIHALKLKTMVKE